MKNLGCMHNSIGLIWANSKRLEATNFNKNLGCLLGTLNLISLNLARSKAIISLKIFLFHTVHIYFILSILESFQNAEKIYNLPKRMEGYDGECNKWLEIGPNRKFMTPSVGQTLFKLYSLHFLYCNKSICCIVRTIYNWDHMALCNWRK